MSFIERHSQVIVGQKMVVLPQTEHTTSVT